MTKSAGYLSTEAPEVSWHLDIAVALERGEQELGAGVGGAGVGGAGVGGAAVGGAAVGGETVTMFWQPHLSLVSSLPEGPE